MGASAALATAWVATTLRRRADEAGVPHALPALPEDAVVAADGSGEPVRLTRGAGADGSPAWAPDGSWIAFHSDRGEEAQVWGIRPDGGEAWQVTDVATGVGGFRISPDGGALAYTASPEATARADSLEKEWGRPMVRDSAYASDWTHLWVAPLET